MDIPVTLEQIDAQEERFASAFATGDVSQARDLYHPEVVYLSPTTRLFGSTRRVEGLDATIEFIQLTIGGCHNITYRLDERAVLPDEQSAYTRIVFDWDTDEGSRVRSIYVVVYRYRDGLIGQQELYYDPNAPLEPVTNSRGEPGWWWLTALNDPPSGAA
jgi:ketosteroid isomerase-like protein